jgi:hypothetical protein
MGEIILMYLRLVYKLLIDFVCMIFGLTNCQDKVKSRLPKQTNGGQVTLGKLVAIPRTAGGFSNATIVRKLPNNKVVVSFTECQQTKHKTVGIYQLREPIKLMDNHLQIDLEVSESSIW